jgi:hypothetical protein
MRPASRRTPIGSCATLHTEQTFEFVADAPMERVAPLFGAHRERDWAPGWNPRFVWPPIPQDREGMVFTVTAGHGTAIWINTLFDLERGRVQYASIIPNTMVTLVDVKLRPVGPQTQVTVAYHRTALDPGSNELVQEMAHQDGRSGPEWAGQIQACLQAAGDRATP